MWQDNMEITEFAGHEVRWLYDGHKWWAVLKDICDVLGITTWCADTRISPEYRCYMDVVYETHRPEKYNENSCLNTIGGRKYYSHKKMVCVNSKGVFQCVSRSRSLKAEQFNLWVADILDELREDAHIAEYNTLAMLQPEVRETINARRRYRDVPPSKLNGWADAIIDSQFYDIHTGCLVYDLILADGHINRVAACDYDQCLSGDWTEEDQERADAMADEFEPYEDPDEGHWERED